MLKRIVNQMMTETGPVPLYDPHTVDSWVVVFPGKSGSTWQCHFGPLSSYEDCVSEAERYCNMCVIPTHLWSEIKRLQSERHCCRIGDQGPFKEWVVYERTRAGDWRVKYPSQTLTVDTVRKSESPPKLDAFPIPRELHRHLNYLEMLADTKLPSEPDRPTGNEPVRFAKPRKHVAHEYWAAVHVHPGDLPAGGYSTAFHGSCPTYSKHDAVQKANNAVDLVALPHNLLRYIRDLERQVAQHKQEEKKDASPQPVTKPVQLNSYASGVGMWVTGWPFSSLPDGARGEVHYGPDGRETYQPYGLE